MLQSNECYVYLPKICHKCKKRGATAGCEVGRCKKSYHYPCAVSDGAEVFNEGDKGVFGFVSEDP